MTSFVIRLSLEPHPWPFSWGPFGLSREKLCRVTNAGIIEIWQRDRKGEDGMVDEPLVVDCRTDRSTCTTTIEPKQNWNAQKLQRRTRQ